MTLITIEWIEQNYINVIQLMIAAVALAEIVTRLTPTKKDDGFIHRIGNTIDKLLIWFPNIKKKLEDKNGPPA
jgi:hypothetical protein